MKSKIPIVAIICLLVSTMVAGQTAPDLATLESRLSQAAALVARSDAPGRASAERELQDLQDELAYLRVKTRRGERVSESERTEFASRITQLTTKLSREGGASTSGPRELPAGTEMDVRLQTPLTSGTAQIEDRVEGTTLVDVYKGDQMLVPAGSLLTGHITSVDRATRTDRTGSLTIRFDRLAVGGRTYDIRATVTNALESEGLKGEKGRIGAGAGVGAVLGGILGGIRGAIAGILIGAGGAVVATEGKDVELPVGTVLRVRLDTALTLDR